MGRRQLRPQENNQQLATQLAKRWGVSRKEAAARLAVVLDVLSQALVSPGRVSLSHFGILEVRSRRARLVKHPAGEQTVRTPAHRYVLFRQSARLRVELNRSYPLATLEGG